MSRTQPVNIGPREPLPTITITPPNTPTTGAVRGAPAEPLPRQISPFRPRLYSVSVNIIISTGVVPSLVPLTSRELIDSVLGIAQLVYGCCRPGEQPTMLRSLHPTFSFEGSLLRLNINIRMITNGNIDPSIFLRHESFIPLIHAAERAALLGRAAPLATRECVVIQCPMERAPHFPGSRLS